MFLFPYPLFFRTEAEGSENEKEAKMPDYVGRRRCEGRRVRKER